MKNPVSLRQNKLMAPTVIKLGGSVLDKSIRQRKLDKLTRSFLKTVISLNKKEPVILVHGGGAEITRALEKSGVKTQFVDGLRYTDEKTIEIVEMVLAGRINKEIVNKINFLGGKAVGLSGKDGKMITAEKIKKLGLVGKPKSVDKSPLELLMKAGIIPVVSSVAADANGKTLNLNADSVASALACVLKAQRLIFLTDVPGVLDGKGKKIKKIKIKDISALVKKGIISRGMLPKIDSCLEAVRKGVKRVIVTDGKKGLNYGTEIIR